MIATMEMTETSETIAMMEPSNQQADSLCLGSALGLAIAIGIDPSSDRSEDSAALAQNRSATSRITSQRNKRLTAQSAGSRPASLRNLHTSRQPKISVIPNRAKGPVRDLTSAATRN